ncbi:MAG: hypothetical protein ACI9VR_002796 [Cognaticolwellia sp.]|jgi:hypothetical protein
MFLLLLACTADPVDTALDDSADTGEEMIDLDQDGSPADVACDLGLRAARQQRRARRGLRGS